MFAYKGIKTAVFLNVASSRSCESRRSGGTSHLHLQDRKNPRESNNISSWLLYLDDGGDTFLQNSVLTRLTWRHIPEGGILHSHRRDNLKSYIALTCWTL
jgi:hypothetical protein